MVFNQKIATYISFISKVTVWVMLLMGIVMRLILFFQDKNLIIDEANIVRNLYERSFAELLLPLSYEQYAPPVFLWIEKAFALLFGYGEKALKIYPLLCGIGSLFVFRAIMKKFVPEETLWLPLALMAFSPYLTEFSATVKQYMPDAFIVLLLLWQALEKDIFTQSKKKFLLFWSIAGGVAICASMPSVFALSGVGLYYAWQCIGEKKTNLIWMPLLLGAIWLTLFAIYFWLILHPQIGSDHLQIYHQDYFLTADLLTRHNWLRIREILNNTAGYGDFNLRCSLVMMLIGIVFLLRKNVSVLLLIGIPILLTLIAAWLHQFSLIMRVSLFLLPLLLLLFSMGFGRVYALRFWPLQVLLIFGGIKMIKVFNNFNLFHTNQGFHEITKGLDYTLSKKTDGQHLYIHHASEGTYVYYTEIHPKRAHYQPLRGAHLMKWDTDYGAVTSLVTDTVYFLYTGGFPEDERSYRTQQLNQHLEQVDYFEKYVCFVYGYAPRRSNSD